MNFKPSLWKIVGSLIIGIIIIFVLWVFLLQGVCGMLGNPAECSIKKIITTLPLFSLINDISIEWAILCLSILIIVYIIWSLFQKRRK